MTLTTLIQIIQVKNCIEQINSHIINSKEEKVIKNKNICLKPNILH